MGAGLSSSTLPPMGRPASSSRSPTIVAADRLAAEHSLRDPGRVVRIVDRDAAVEQERGGAAAWLLAAVQQGASAIVSCSRNAPRSMQPLPPSRSDHRWLPCAAASNR